MAFDQQHDAPFEQQPSAASEEQPDAPVEQPGTAFEQQPGTAFEQQPGTAFPPQPGTAIPPQPGTAFPPQAGGPFAPPPGVAFQPQHRAASRGPALVGAIIGVAVLLGVFIGFAVSRHGGEEPTTGPKPAPAGTPGVTSCAWTLNANPAVTKTGVPPTDGVPASGVRDLTFMTSQGNITITLDLAHAPCGGASMTYLAGAKFFDNTSCHRLTTSGIYVLQCGDPSGTGGGGPSYTWDGENYPTSGPMYQKGVVAMAIPSNDDGSPATNLNGSQFFIVWKDTPLDPGTGQPALKPYYTIIGTVTQGMDVVQKVANGGVYPTDPTILTEGTPKLSVIIKSVTVGPLVGASTH